MPKMIKLYILSNDALINMLITFLKMKFKRTARKKLCSLLKICREEKEWFSKDLVWFSHLEIDILKWIAGNFIFKKLRGNKKRIFMDFSLQKIMWGIVNLN